LLADAADWNRLEERRFVGGRIDLASAGYGEGRAMVILSQSMQSPLAPSARPWRASRQTISTER
jgi:hypothetical protein